MNRKATILGAGTLLLAGLLLFRPFRFFDDLLLDLSFVFTSEDAADSVIVVGIDAASIQEVGAMPWPRSTIARLTELVASGKPRALALDFLFPPRPDQAENDSLSSVFSRVDNLVLPFKAGKISADATEGALSIPGDLYNHRFLKIANQDRLGDIQFYSATEISAPDTLFSRHARYGGFLNVSTSRTSQKLREVIHVIRAGTEFFPSFGLSAVAAYYGARAGEFVLDGKGCVVIAGNTVPITSYAASSRVNFRRGKRPLTVVPAVDVLEGRTDTSRFKDRLVFLGVTDPSAGADFFVTPVESRYPGVAVWATMALDVVQKKWIRSTGTLLTLLNWVIALLMFPGCALLVPSRRRQLSFWAITGACALSIAAGIVSMQFGDTWWESSSHVYAWLFGIFWLGARRADPALPGQNRLDLEPPEESADAFLSPPSSEELEADLEPTESSAFITRTLSSLTSTLADEQAEPAAPTALLSQRVRELAAGTIVRNLGSGGMADVYLVWNPRLEVYRAVKVIRPDQSSALQTRFETEIRIFSKLVHPNIVHCYSVGDWHGLPYLEMEYVHGASMESVLKRCTVLSVEQALAIGILVCRALQYAHNQTITMYGKSYNGIIHRDLKPANIMLGRGGAVRLTDFGIARPRDVSLHTADTGSVVGTLPYLAPEQLQGGELTARTDLYALGATLYEFISGERAFPQNDIGAMLSAKNTGNCKALPSARVSGDVAAIVSRAMAVRQSDRYRDARAMQRDMESALMKLVPDKSYMPLLTLVKRMWS